MSKNGDGGGGHDWLCMDDLRECHRKAVLTYLRCNMLVGGFHLQRNCLCSFWSPLESCSFYSKAVYQNGLYRFRVLRINAVIVLRGDVNAVEDNVSFN